MKKIITFIFTLFIIFSSFAQNGKIMEFKTTSSKGMSGKFIMNYSEYGAKIEINMAMPQMPNGGIKMVSITQKDNPDVTYALNETNKTYNETKKSGKHYETVDKSDYTVTKMGEEKINGYKCIHALVTQGKETYDVWNTKDFPDYDKYAEALNNNEKLSASGRQKALKDAGCDGFPVKTIHKGNERSGDMTMELVKTEKKTFSKSDFEIPSDYKKTESNSYPSGMKSNEEIKNMTPEERAKYIEEMKRKYGK